MDNTYTNLRSALDIEISQRTAGDQASLNAVNGVQDQTAVVGSGLSTEVVQREAGDLRLQGLYATLGLDFSNLSTSTQSRITDLAVRMDLAEGDLATQVNLLLAAFTHTESMMEQAIADEADARNEQYSGLDNRVAKYEYMLGNITADSIQITADNDQINAGAWTILSQARKWDLEILALVENYRNGFNDSLDSALEDLQEQIANGDANAVSNAIEAISSAPIMQELDGLISGQANAIDGIKSRLQQEIDSRIAEAQATVIQMTELGESLSDTFWEALQGETTARLEAIAHEAQIRGAQFETLAGSILDELNERANDLQDETLALLDTIQDGLHTEIQERKDAAENILIQINSYKVSNDLAVSTAVERIQTLTDLTGSHTTKLDALQSQYNTADGNISGNALAIQNLSSKVTQQGDLLVSQGESITTLTSGLVDANTGITQNSNAISSLTTTAITNAGVVSSHSNAITALQSDLESARTAINTKASAIALNNLSTTVTEQGNTLTSQGTQITSINNSITTINGDLATKASASALSALDSKVTTQGNTITTQSGQITSLQNSLDTKASSTALSELTSRVSSAEGVNTSQSTNITNLQNSVTTINETLSTKADSSALSTLQSTVTSQGNTITSQGSQITSLTNTLGTKADSSTVSTLDSKVTQQGTTISSQGSAITGLTNRVTTVEGTANTAITNAASALTVANTGVTNAAAVSTGLSEFKASFGGAGTNLVPGPYSDPQEVPVMRVSGINTPTMVDSQLRPKGKAYRFQVNTSTNTTGFSMWSDSATNIPLDYTGGNRAVIVSFWMKGDPGTAGHELQVYLRHGTEPTAGITGASGSSLTVFLAETWTQYSFVATIASTYNYIGLAIRPNRTGVDKSGTVFYMDNLMIERQIAQGTTPSPFVAGSTAITQIIAGVREFSQSTADAQSATAANVTALTSRMGVVEGTAANALTTANTAVTQNSANANSITSLESRLLSNAKNLLPNGSFERGTTGWNYSGILNPTTQYNTSGWGYIFEGGAVPNGTYVIFSEKIPVFPNSTYTVTGDSLLFAANGCIAYFDCVGYASMDESDTSINYDSPQTVISGEHDFSNEGKRRSDHAVTFTVPSNCKALRVRFVFQGTNIRAWGCRQIKLARTTEVTAYDNGIDIGSNASAITTLNTKVTTIDGRVTSSASNITSLQTTVGQHTTKINDTALSLDGVEAVRAVSIDNNGVISGFGLISQLVNGQVNSAFGVNADYFYVGTPNNGKRPFMVLTSSQTINGTTYPAGTWIDVALIANATIDTAHIANAAITSAKIGDASITAAKIKDLEVDTIKIKNGAVSNMTIFRSTNGKFSYPSSFPVNAYQALLGTVTPTPSVLDISITVSDVKCIGLLQSAFRNSNYSLFSSMGYGQAVTAAYDIYFLSKRIPMNEYFWYKSPIPDGGFDIYVLIPATSLGTYQVGSTTPYLLGEDYDSLVGSGNNANPRTRLDNTSNGNSETINLYLQGFEVAIVGWKR